MDVSGVPALIRRFDLVSVSACNNLYLGMVDQEGNSYIDQMLLKVSVASPPFATHPARHHPLLELLDKRRVGSRCWT